MNPRPGRTDPHAPTPPRWAIQDGYDVRFDWGAAGIERLAGGVKTVVVIDVLRFTTAVESAVAAGLRVRPHRWRDESAHEVAKTMNAVLAGASSGDGPSLSPASLIKLGPGTRVVLPSPNGATCALLAAERGVQVLAGCLRNATAVAEHVALTPGPTAVIACGELWHDGSLQPALEDLLGAGAILARLPGRLSPDAEAAVAVHRHFEPDLHRATWECASGRALRERGYDADVDWAAAVDASRVVPILEEGWFQAATPPA